MIFAAQRDLGLDLALARCVLVGDKSFDLAAGEAAGVGTRILVHATRNPQSQCLELNATNMDQVIYNLS